MCQAILRLKYQNSRDTQVQTVEDLKDLDAAIEKAKAIPTVSKVSVFILDRTIELTPTWKVVPSDVR